MKGNKQEFSKQGFADEDMNLGGDEYPHCEDESCVNMAEDEEEAGDNSSAMTADEDTNKAASEWHDKYLRLSAEFDNYRKRTLKEKANLALMGGETVIKALLPVLDDMDRALEAMRQSSDIDGIRTGIELISSKLNDCLKYQGLKEIEAVGQELDTDFHEAVAKTPVEDAKKGKIVDVTTKGYSLKDKVIRHAKVVVGE